MRTFITKILVLLIILSTSVSIHAQEFQGKAYYFSKTPMELGRWGATMSEQRKKQIAERLKNRLEKNYILTFNKEESLYKEDEKLDAISGATDSWGSNFTPGTQYKNIKTNTFLQSQEFYGKKFLVKENMQPLKWKMGTESKQIGQYMCFKATTKIPVSELTWYTFSWDRVRRNNRIKKTDTIKADEGASTEIEAKEIVAWYTPQIPISQGPGEYWGLPGLILEVNVDSTTILCSKIVINPKEKIKIEAPDNGKEVTKMEYKKIITEKMQEFRSNRGRGNRPRN